MTNWGKIYCSSLWGDESNKNSLPVRNFVQCLDCPPIVNYPFSNKSELQTAVDLWTTNTLSAICTYGEINTWDVSAVPYMGGIFSGKTNFNDDISNWNMSNVIDMNNMFFEASAFNKDINSWDVSGVTNMGGMFRNASSFNQDITAWNVSNVTGMQNMFRGASAFNQDIGSWDTSIVINMYRMFYEVSSFNQDLSSWDVSNVTQCDGFNKNTPQWTLPKPNLSAGCLE